MEAASRRLGDFCDFKYGKMPSKSDLVETGFPVFSGYRIVGAASSYHYEKPEIVVVARGVGGTGDVKMAPAKCFLTNLSIAILPMSEEIDKTFLFYELSVRGLWHLRTGSAQAQITIERLREEPVRVPPLAVQRRIAQIAKAYDDLIENCERRIKGLDEMVRALYREWFVELRYPGHRSQARGGPSGLPSGWATKFASEALWVNPAVELPRTGTRPFVPMTSLSESSLVIADVETRDKTSGAKFQNGDTLLARITPCLENGKTGFVQFLRPGEAGACGSTEFIVLRGRLVPPEFVYCLARSEGFRAHAIKSMSGATGRQRVQEACFDVYPVAVPPMHLLERFVALARPAFELAQQLHERSANLRDARDSLLPRLLSGQLAVAEAA